MPPPRLALRRTFSLRTLWIAISLACVALAVWAYVPDPNNTLPMARIVPPDVLAPIRGTNQPQIVWLSEEPALEGSGHRKHWFAIVNPTSDTLHYQGYTMDSWEHRPPLGEISPIYTPEHQTAMGWIPDRLGGLCGTGLGELVIKAGRAAKFAAYDRDPDLPFRISVGYTRTKRGAPAGGGVLVSDPAGR